jgi:hypothetical protein
MYSNIIIYIDDIIFRVGEKQEKWDRSVYYYNIYWVAKAVKQLKKNGNLIFRLPTIITDYASQIFI